MKKLFVVLLFLIGCSADPVSTTKTDNTNIVVEKLFTHDGCVVYRFHDYHYRYFVKCQNSCKTMQDVQVGKTTYLEEIETK